MSNARTLASTINSSSQIVVPSGGIAFTDLNSSNDAATANEAYVMGQDGYETGSWTPTLTNVNPLGNAIIAQNKYVKIGTLVYLSVNITFGSSTTFIIGDIRISSSSLPFTPSASGHGSAWLYDSDGAAQYVLPVVIPTSTVSDIKIASTTTANGDDITNTAPFTWAVNDRINLSLTYTTS